MNVVVDFIAHYPHEKSVGTAAFWIQIAIYVLIMLYMVPIFIKANGTRPLIRLPMDLVTILTISALVLGYHNGEPDTQQIITRTAIQVLIFFRVWQAGQKAKHHIQPGIPDHYHAKHDEIIPVSPPTTPQTPGEY